MRHLECTDILSVILDPVQRVSEGGIVVDEDSAILENKKQRYATVHAAPEFYTITRATGHNTIKHIRTRSPVKTLPVWCCCARRRPVPASSPVVRCAPCSSVPASPTC